MCCEQRERQEAKKRAAQKKQEREAAKLIKEVQLSGELARDLSRARAAASHFVIITHMHALGLLHIHAHTHTHTHTHASAGSFASGASWQVLAIDFSPNGYHVATGSDDNTVRTFMRMRVNECVGLSL